MRQVPTRDYRGGARAPEVEVVLLHRSDVRIAHHVHDVEDVGAVACFRGHVGGAGVAEGEEVGLPAGQLVAEHAASDGDEAIPLLADFNVRLPGGEIRVNETARVAGADGKQVFGKRL